MKNKEKAEAALLRMVERVVRHEVTKHNEDWPPHCWGILHQPKRPKKQ